MEEQPPLPSAGLSPQSSSLITRMVNVFVSPSEDFDEIKVTPPKHTNWAVPLILGIIMGIISIIVVFSQPGVIQKIKDAQDKKFQESVQQGKMTRQQADQAQAAIDKFMTPTLMQLFGIGGVIMANIAMLFLIASIVWLLGRFIFKSEMNYMQALQVNGLSSLIKVLGTIIAMLLAIIYGNMSITPGPVLLVSHFDPSNKIHLLLSAINLFAIWYVGVLALGLARLSGASYAKSASWLYGLWAFFTLGPILAFWGR